MRTGNNIIMLFQQHKLALPFRDRFPFAVRMSNWSTEYYVVVEHVEVISYQYGNAFGSAFKNGNHSELFSNDQFWREKKRIPRCDNLIWVLADDISMSHYKNYGAMNVYETNSRLKWGKHKWLSIEEIAMIEPTYLEWCITDQDRNFAISIAAIETLKSLGVVLKDFHLELNSKKLKWYETDLDDNFKPDLYKTQEAEYKRRVDAGEIEEDPF
jgi:hypothetical protein